ncbi:hypothetical protein [Nitrosomonas supralitoralis]|uniref:Uncharacterized protein n=1 Tax=Nitrosomonas supralitoralis TaxID=2116706 RepID=A0A2P7NTW4_9PROT|nr:hypothetical protein [Nitrosomonas supralitoralis]PSJ16910.1 hypothetical protein C7H79_11140 [Nitrosomonas supralitoralis]
MDKSDAVLKKKEMKQEEIETLKRMAAQWHNWAECKFKSAKHYPKERFGRKFVEHGATCYRNCAWDLEREIRRLEGYEE